MRNRSRLIKEYMAAVWDGVLADAAADNLKELRGQGGLLGGHGGLPCRHGGLPHSRFRHRRKLRFSQGVGADCVAEYGFVSGVAGFVAARDFSYSAIDGFTSYGQFCLRHYRLRHYASSLLRIALRHGRPCRHLVDHFIAHRRQLAIATP
jgi:hypothetical protein